MSGRGFTFVPAENYTPSKKEEPSIEDEEKKYDFSFTKSTQPEEISNQTKVSESRRHLARTGARVGETIAGIPGNIRQMADSVGEWLGDKGRQFIGKDPLTQEQKQQIKKEMEPSSWNVLNRLINSFPSTSDIRENVTQQLTGDYLEPQSENEELSDEVFSDLAGLMLPVKGASGKLKIPFSRAIATTLFANTTGEAAKAYGLEPDEAGYAKMGAMFLAGLMGRDGARNYARGLYKDSIDMIPENAVIGSQKLLNKVDSYMATLKKGGITPEKQPALSLANQMRQKLLRGDIEVSEIPEFRVSANDYRFNRQAGLTQRGRYFLDRFDDILNEELMEYGKDNPAFLRKYRDANTGLAGFKQSNRIADYISKKVDVTQMKPETLLILGMHVHEPGLMAKIGVTAGAAKVAQLMHRVGKNPVLRQYYLNVMNESLKGNSAAMLRNLDKLDIEVAKDFQKSEEE